MTFLDLVRALGNATLNQCDGECGAYLHRREAAHHLIELLKDRELTDGFFEVAINQHRAQ